MAYLGTNSNQFDPTRTTAAPRDADRFSGNGSTVAFTLTRAVNKATDVEVFVENVQQEPLTAYDAVGTTLTFTGAPPSGTNNVYVVYRNFDSGAQVTVPDGSITYNKLANNIRIFTTDNLVPNGSTVAFTLSEAPADANTVMVTVDGIVQRAPVHYTTSGSTITFASAPAASSNVHVRHLGFRTSTTVTALAANSTISQPNIQSAIFSGNTKGTGQFALNANGYTPTFGGSAILTIDAPSGSPSLRVRESANTNTRSDYFVASGQTELNSYDDNSLQFKNIVIKANNHSFMTGPAGTNTAMTIDSAGRVLKPYQTKAGGYPGGAGAWSSNQDPINLYATVNDGSAWNTGTYTFLAPVTGTYRVWISMLMGNNSSYYGYIYLKVNGSSGVTMAHFNAMAGYTTSGGSYMIKLNAGDTLGFLTSASGNVIYNQGHGTWGIELIG